MAAGLSQVGSPSGRTRRDLLLGPGLASRSGAIAPRSAAAGSGRNPATASSALGARGGIARARAPAASGRARRGFGPCRSSSGRRCSRGSPSRSISVRRLDFRPRATRRRSAGGVALDPVAASSGGDDPVRAERPDGRRPGGTRCRRHRCRRPAQSRAHGGPASSASSRTSRRCSSSHAGNAPRSSGTTCVPPRAALRGCSRRQHRTLSAPAAGRPSTSWTWSPTYTTVAPSRRSTSALPTPHPPLEVVDVRSQRWVEVELRLGRRFPAGHDDGPVAVGRDGPRSPSCTHRPGRHAGDGAVGERKRSGASPAAAIASASEVGLEASAAQLAGQSRGWSPATRELDVRARLPGPGARRRSRVRCRSAIMSGSNPATTSAACACHHPK